MQASTKHSAGNWQGVRTAGTSKGQNKVKARWIGDDPRVISHSDPSSGDSIEPVRSQVSKHPPGIVVVYCENLPPPFTDGPARWFSRLYCAFSFITLCFIFDLNSPIKAV